MGKAVHLNLQDFLELKCELHVPMCTYNVHVQVKYFTLQCAHTWLWQNGDTIIGIFVTWILVFMDFGVLLYMKPDFGWWTQVCPSIYLCAILSTIMSKVFSFSLCSHCWISHIHLCTSLWCRTLSSCSWPAMHCTLSEQSRKTLNISSYDNQCVSCSSACFI